MQGHADDELPEISLAVVHMSKVDLDSHGEELDVDAELKRATASKTAGQHQQHQATAVAVDPEAPVTRYTSSLSTPGTRSPSVTLDAPPLTDVPLTDEPSLDEISLVPGDDAIFYDCDDEFYDAE